jgi:hypothetical protein
VTFRFCIFSFFTNLSNNHTISQYSLWICGSSDWNDSKKFLNI